MPHPPSLQELIPVLQLAIGPVILISGIGLLMLSMTNRYGRTIDRARDLSRQRRTAGESIKSIEAQLVIILRRAAMLRRAISFAAIAVLLAAILIIVLFSTVLVQIDVAWALAIIFIACLACVIVSLIYLIRDINESMAALKMEVGQQE